MGEMMILDRETAFFISNKEKLLKENPGLFALIKGDSLIGIYNSRAEAYDSGISKYGNIPFLVKKIISEETEDFLSMISVGL